jgi:hypothetical protein
MRKLMALMALCSAAALAETWTGVISDDACAAKHVAATAADQRCAASCIKSGGKAVFVEGDKVYNIDNQAAVKGHEGQKVTLSGTMTGDTIHIDSVK